MKHVAVIGASLAGLSAARALRAQGFEGRVDDSRRRRSTGPTTVRRCRRNCWPGRSPSTNWRSSATTRICGADWRLGVRAERLEIAAGLLDLDDGSTLHADGIVIATGAAARPFPGTEGLAGVHVLRTLDDALALRADTRGRDPTGRRRGRIHRRRGGVHRSLPRRRRHRDRGGADAVVRTARGADGRDWSPACTPITACACICGVEVSGVELAGVEVAGPVGTERVTAVALADGRQIPADVVVIGIGAVPNVEWLHDSGLDIGNGVHCDEAGGTGHPSVVAVGDCSAWLNPRTGRHQRVEHWTAARDRPSIAVATLLSHATGTVPAEPSSARVPRGNARRTSGRTSTASASSSPARSSPTTR